MPPGSCLNQFSSGSFFSSGFGSEAAQLRNPELNWVFQVSAHPYYITYKGLYMVSEKSFGRTETGLITISAILHCILTLKFLCRWTVTF